MQSYPLLTLFFSLVLFLFFLAWMFPSPTMIGVVTLMTGGVILLQAFLILKGKV